MTLDYQNLPDRRNDSIHRVSHTTLKCVLATFVVCAVTLGAATLYSLGYSRGYNASERENTETALLRDSVLARVSLGASRAIAGGR